MSYCPNCGSPIAPETDFCTSCGTKLQSQKELTVHFIRKKSFVAALMPYKVSIDCTDHGKLSNGKDMTVKLPHGNMLVQIDMVGNSMNIHPMTAETTITPGPQHTRVECVISTVAQIGGIFGMGVTQAPGRIELDVKYF